MKTWLKGGLIGLGIGFLIGIITAIIMYSLATCPQGMECDVGPIIKTQTGILFGVVLGVIGFIIGAIIGKRKKERKEERKKKKKPLYTIAYYNVLW